jgi:hypothetical protein
MISKHHSKMVDLHGVIVLGRYCRLLSDDDDEEKIRRDAHAMPS